jgi:predicted O-methyltransferase YrrM
MSEANSFPNWFAGQQYLFERFLSEFTNKSNLKFLQIGTYTGDASVWMLDNVLTDTTSTLTDVDTWAGSDEVEHNNINFDKVYDYYKRRTESYSNISSIQNDSDNFFKSNIKPVYNFIYIDGDHTSAQVLKDAENAWNTLLVSGIMAFDDYLWGQGMPPELTPRPAIDEFLNKYKNDIEILAIEYQVWIRKIDKGI